MSGPYNPVPTIAPDAGTIDYQHLDLSPDAFGAGVGHSLEQAGKVTQQIVGEIQAQHNETLLNDASTRLSDEYGKIEAEYRQEHGNNAVAKLPEFQARLAQARANVEKDLPSNPDVRHAFGMRATQYQSQTSRGFGLHAADQADKAYVDSLEGNISAAKSRLVREAGLGKAAPNYDELVDSVAQLGLKLGWEPGQAHAYLQKQTGDVVTDLVAARIAANQLGAAQNIFKTAVKANVPGTDLPFLDADTQARVSHVIHTEIKTQEALHRAEAAQDAADLAQSDIASRLETGVALPAEAQARIRAGMTPRQYDRYLSNAERASQVNKGTGDLKFKSDIEIKATYETLKPKGGELDYEQQLKTYKAAKTQGDSIIAQRAADPATAARNVFTQVQYGWQGWEKNQKDPGWMQLAVKRSLAGQDALKIEAANQKPLPAPIAAQVTGALSNRDPAQANQALKHYEELFGKYWDVVYRQIGAKMDPAVKVAATIEDNDVARMTMIDASRAKRADLLKITGLKQEELQAAVAGNGTFEDFRNAMGPGGVRGGTVPQTSEAIQTLALGYMVGGETSPVAAVEKATADVMERYRFGNVNDKTFAAPKTVDLPAVEAAAEDVMRTVDVSQFDLPTGLAGQTIDDRKRTYETAVRNGHWVTVAGLKGLALSTDRGVVTRNGRPVVYTWDQLLYSGADAEKPMFATPGADLRIK